MSNRLYQSIIHQMKDAMSRTIGVIDENGIIIACSELSRIGESMQKIREELSYSSETAVIDGYTYRYISVGGKVDGLVFVEGEDKHAEKMSAILAVSLGNIRNLYDDKYDKGSFIKNIMLDNILPSDIYVKSKELHFDSECDRVVYIIKFATQGSTLPYEMVQELFPDREHDYVININETDVVLVREMADGAEEDKTEELAHEIESKLSSGYGVEVSIGCSTVVDNLKDLARAYKEARIALEVGKVFDTEKSVISYENLGIGRLIYQLPTTLCEIFLQEVFKKGSLDSLDKETLMTVQSFFENNLNVSETSRKLFVHRNTLVYRLEKIRKITGLDLRQFDHAVTFKVALMVKKYLTSRPAKF